MAPSATFTVYQGVVLLLGERAPLLSLATLATSKRGKGKRFYIHDGVSGVSLLLLALIWFLLCSFFLVHFLRNPSSIPTFVISPILVTYLRKHIPFLLAWAASQLHQSDILRPLPAFLSSLIASHRLHPGVPVSRENHVFQPDHEARPAQGRAQEQRPRLFVAGAQGQECQERLRRGGGNLGQRRLAGVDEHAQAPAHRPGVALARPAARPRRRRVSQGRRSGAARPRPADRLGRREEGRGLVYALRRMCL